MSFFKQFEHSLKYHRLLSKGDTVVVGVSGGSDSMALLRAFSLLRASWGLRVIAAHVNHKLRKSADRDERFVEAQCLKQNIPFFSRTVMINIDERRDSVEQKARDKRLEALLKITKKTSAGALALAHHQNDLAETVLMRILRGSGLAGLQAMTPERIFQDTRVIRPLLHIPKEEILEFCAEQKILFRNDPTNRSKTFLRNRIRHDLIPMLQSYNPKISKALATLAEESADDYGFLQLEVRRHFKTCAKELPGSKGISISVEKFCRLHPAIQKMVLRFSVEKLKGDLRCFERKHIQTLQGLLSGKSSRHVKVELPCRITAQKVSASTLIIRVLSGSKRRPA